MKDSTVNLMKLEFDARSVNESFARTAVAAFAAQCDPGIGVISDIKTVVSEAVTNSIVHGYPDGVGEITLEALTDQNSIHINIFDNGVGIEDINKALEPFYTTKLEDERSGMGFTIMKSFMDKVEVVTKKGEGTKIYMTKQLSRDE